MFQAKKTNYNYTISTTDYEEQLVETGEITGFHLDTPLGKFSLPISEFSEPFQIPLTDKETGEFKGWSTYSLRKFKVPAGTYGGVKIFSKEEIAKMNSKR